MTEPLIQPPACGERAALIDRRRYLLPNSSVWLSFVVTAVFAVFSSSAVGQTAHRPAPVELGSKTAKQGFKNEDEIRDKFNNWKTDIEGRTWLGFMGYKPDEIESVLAAKPHGEKADVVVTVKTKAATRKEGISIKLVSTQTGFNQIDKRWLATYAKHWKMPTDVEAALRLYVGEVKPSSASRETNRMYINEFDTVTQKKIVDFFAANKAEIVSDIIKGDGEFSAGWMMVALKSAEKPRWVLRGIDYVIRFYSEGPVEITRQGNLKIGRISMQRKGGDGGRETAKMLQFKINPALLFECK
ncbi:MAG: type II restriction endonuclease [Acidobacteria bacterium]|nr:type II restriction endonuclease [Acidobacteriota bacterium]